MSDWTHDGLAHDLALWLSEPANHNPGWITWENIEFNSQAIEPCRPDVFALAATLSDRRWVPTTFEVKVTRADFLSDLRSRKWEKYLPFSARFAFAITPGIVGAGELPDGCGLIVREPQGWVWHVKRRSHRYWELSPRLWMNLVLKARNPSPWEITQARVRERESA